MDFIQEHFNVEDDKSFEKIMKNIEKMSRNLNIKDKGKIQELNKWIQRGQSIKLLRGFDKYSKFEELGNFGLDSEGLNNTYRLIEEIIYDINIAGHWLESFKIISANIRAFNKSPDALHTELVALGQSILARAVELCPIDTGNLRKSGTLYDFGQYIIITFTAPYALYVHEDMEKSHKVGRAKYLEVALQEFFPECER